MKSKLIFGFHAVTARIRHEASTVDEIYIDANRHDRRMGELIRAAKDQVVPNVGKRVAAIQRPVPRHQHAHTVVVAHLVAVVNRM